MQVLTALERKIAYSTINCVRIGIVEEFNAENLTVKCKIANKLVTGLTPSGVQETRDYPPIYAKVQYLGWGEVGITYPIQAGTEGILLFSDREIESCLPIEFSTDKQPFLICNAKTLAKITSTINCINCLFFSAPRY